MNKPFIVAEMGANHLGDKNRAIQIVESAAHAGADAVKIQCWTPGTMCLDRAYEIKGGPWAGQKLFDLYEQAYTPWEWIPDLQEVARERGIILFASVFDRGALCILQRFNCPIYKIASFELVDKPLIEAVAATGKPMIMSLGMATFEEISSAWAWAHNVGAVEITLLKCSSAYPAPIEELNLATITHLQAAFTGGGTTIGFSDHTTGATAAAVATALGATVIEKHFTLGDDCHGPDEAFSATPGDFHRMVKACRAASRALGEKRYGPTLGEHPDLRRSLYAAKNIAKGDRLTVGNVATARPALGLPPKNYDTLTTGSVAASRPIAAGEPIGMAELAIPCPDFPVGGLS